MLRRHFSKLTFSAVASEFALSLYGSSVTIETGGSKIEVAVSPGPFDLSQAQLLKWVSRAASNVTT